MSSVRFSISKSTPSGNNGHVDPENGDGFIDSKPANETDALQDSENVEDANPENDNTEMALYEEDYHGYPKISKILSDLANYQGGLAPNIQQIKDGSQPPKDSSSADQKKKAANKLGTLFGVFFPCVQNIFGVILFLRLVWVVGTAGWLLAFIIVFMCCCSTMLTSISMSAIATNGVVPAGGSYFMISRSLGPEFGGAVGILFYLGTSVASSMYIVGSIEILLQYMAPNISLFGDVTITSNAANNYRVYGTILLIILGLWVFLGVKIVSKFGTIALACVVLSILAVYIGIFTARSGHGPKICLLGGRLLTSDVVSKNGGCFKQFNINSTIFNKYCKGSTINGHLIGNDTMHMNINYNITNAQLTKSCKFFYQSDIQYIDGIPGLASGMIKENFQSHFSKKKNNLLDNDETGDRSRGEIVVDMTTTFVILIGIFFPSVTGIMAGSNRSGDLADPSKSIPAGTITACALTSTVYLSCVLFFGSVVHGQLLRDKLGESIDGTLIVAQLAWPNPWVILVGSFLSTMGAGLQSLCGAPRLLQAIANDGVIPFLHVFSKTSKSGEPLYGLLLTVIISEIGILIASLDAIAPIITMFFLMCYAFVNLACALQTILKSPSWRPRFRYYHWSLSLIGLFLCITLMFLTSWYYALSAILLAAGIYKYIEYKGAEKEWGDGISGLAMSAAKFALQKLEQGPPHVKNWRPQLLLLVDVNENMQPKYRKLITFAGQLKAGKGLTLVSTLLEGKIKDRYDDAQLARTEINKALKSEKLKAFPEITIVSDIIEGLCHSIQSSGVGGLRHNTVMLNWPYEWKQNADDKSFKLFIETIRNVTSIRHALLIPKNIDNFPTNFQKVTGGTIDIWWIIHDGGLLMLLPFLLMQHKVWAKCKMRVFTVAQLEDNSLQMETDLKKLLYNLRITASVEIVEMSSSDISAYAYERTMLMEERNEMLKELRSKKDLAISRKMSIPNTIVELEKVDLDNLEKTYTFNPHNKGNNKKKADKTNIRMMHTAVKLNNTIIDKSKDAQLVIMNLPALPKHAMGEENYMEYLEALTDGLNRVLLVRGGGREVITIFS